jgi:hypothetical protein
MDFELPATPLRIDCDECVMAGSTACADCVVTFLCTRDERGAVVVDIAEVRALRLLHDGGLAPALRHRPLHQAAGPGCWHPGDVSAAAPDGGC